MNDSKAGSLINQENLQRGAEALTRLGEQYRERMLAGAAEAGKVLARMTRRGVEWTVQS